MIKSELHRVEIKWGAAYDSPAASIEFATKRAPSIVSKMVTEYNAKKRAYEATNTSFKKTGTIDISRLSSYLTSDDIFTSKSIVKSGKNHGVVLVIDWSSSMSDNVMAMAKQYLIVASFCKTVGIPFTVSLFTSITQHLKQTLIANDSMSIGDVREVFYHMCAADLMRKSYYLSNIQLNFSNVYTAMLNGTFQMGGTPLMQSAYTTYIDAYKMKRDRKLDNVTIMYITDGAGSTWTNNSDEVVTTVECPFTKRQYDCNMKNTIRCDRIMSSINRMTRDAGMKVFNLFIGTSEPRGAFARMDDRDTLYEYTMPRNEISPQIVEYPNLAYYNKVIYVHRNVFFDTKVDDAVTAKQFIKKTAKSNANVSLVGSMIVSEICKDFSVTK